MKQFRNLDRKKFLSLPLHESKSNAEPTTSAESPSHLRFQSKIEGAGRHNHRILSATCADISRPTQGNDIRHRQGIRSSPWTLLQRSSSLFLRQWSRDQETPVGPRGIAPAIVDGRESVSRPYRAAT